MEAIAKPLRLEKGDSTADELMARLNAQMTMRLIQFHNALVERGQIAPPPPSYGVTGDCKADQAVVEDQFQQPSATAFRR